MKNTSPDVDRYIEKAAPFAQPILKRIRKAFHKAHPEITETMKWSFPHFEYKGVLGSMAAFKQHVTWGFWKAKLMNDPKGILAPIGETSMGGNRVEKLADLPSEDVIVEYVREAVRLNEEGKKVERRPPVRSADVDIPAELTAALKKNGKAKKTFDAFPPSHKREYAEWIREAKQEGTRQKRIATAIEWMSEGKPRNWKYMKSK